MTEPDAAAGQQSAVWFERRTETERGSVSRGPNVVARKPWLTSAGRLLL